MTLQATNPSRGATSPRALSNVDAWPTLRHLDTMASCGWLCVDETARGSSRTVDNLGIRDFELARKFVDHLIAEQTARTGRNGFPTGAALDWHALTTSVADSTSLERAIGRAVARADRLIRGTSSENGVVQVGPSSTAQAPFFAFTQADAVPDFGDDRYRSRLARRIARIGKRHAAVIGD